MKIVRINTNITSPAIAEVYINNKTDRLYYNLTHGTMGDSLWKWVAMLDASKFRPAGINDTLTLTGNDYNIVPIKKDKNNYLKDNVGNMVFKITTDTSEEHKNDLLVLWDIPNKKYDNIFFNLYGLVDTIGMGKNGKVRESSTISTPAPILEVQGESEFTWVAKKGDSYYKQVCTYKNNEIDLRPITNIDADEYTFLKDNRYINEKMQLK